MEQLFYVLTQYGIDITVCAIVTTVLTGILKLPLKKIAERSSNSKKLTRFITFLPIVVGFGIAVLYTYLESNSIQFDKPFYTRWLSSVSLSLAIYAFWEKFFPAQKNVLSDAELSANQAAIREISNIVQQNNEESTEKQNAEGEELVCKEETNSNTVAAGSFEANMSSPNEISSKPRRAGSIILLGENHAEITKE